MELPQTATLLVWGILVATQSGADPAPTPIFHPHHNVGTHSVHISPYGQVSGHAAHLGPTGHGHLVNTVGPHGQLGSLTHYGPAGSFSHLGSHVSPLYGGGLHFKSKPSLPHFRERSGHGYEEYPIKRHFSPSEPEYHREPFILHNSPYQHARNNPTNPETLNPYEWSPKPSFYDQQRPFTFEPQKAMMSYRPQKRMTVFEPQKSLIPNVPYTAMITYEPQNPLFPYSQYKPVIPVGPQEPLIPYFLQKPLIPYSQYKPVIPVGPQKPFILYFPQTPLIPYSQYKPVIPVGPQKPFIPYFPQTPLIPYSQYKPVIPFGPQQLMIPYLPQTPLIQYGQNKPVIPIWPQQSTLSYGQYMHAIPYRSKTSTMPFSLHKRMIKFEPQESTFSNENSNYRTPHESKNSLNEVESLRPRFANENSKNIFPRPAQKPLLEFDPLKPTFRNDNFNNIIPLPPQRPFIPYWSQKPSEPYLFPVKTVNYLPTPRLLIPHIPILPIIPHVPLKPLLIHKPLVPIIPHKPFLHPLLRLPGLPHLVHPLYRHRRVRRYLAGIYEYRPVYTQDSPQNVLQKEEEKGVETETKLEMKPNETRSRRKSSNSEATRQSSEESVEDDLKDAENVTELEKQDREELDSDVERKQRKKGPEKPTHLLKAIEKQKHLARSGLVVNCKEVKSADEGNAILEEVAPTDDPKVKEIVEKIQTLTGQASDNSSANLENTDIKEETGEKILGNTGTTESPHGHEQSANLPPPPHPTQPQGNTGVNYDPNFPTKHVGTVAQSYNPPNYGQYPFSNAQHVLVPGNNQGGYAYDYPPNNQNHLEVQYGRNAYVLPAPPQGHSYGYNGPYPQGYYLGSPYPVNTAPIPYALSRPLYVPYTGNYLNDPSSPKPNDCSNPNARQFIDPQRFVQFNGYYPRSRSNEGESIFESNLQNTLPKNDAYGGMPVPNYGLYSNGPMSYPPQSVPYYSQNPYNHFQSYIPQYPQYHVPNYGNPIKGIQYGPNVPQGKPYVRPNLPPQTSYPVNHGGGEKPNKPSKPEHDVADILKDLHKTYQENLASINKLTTERLNLLRDLLFQKRPLSSLTLPSLLDVTKLGSHGGVDASHVEHVDQHKGLSGYNTQEYDHEGQDYGYGQPPWTGPAGYGGPGTGVTDLGGLHRVDGPGKPYHQVHKDKGYETKEVSVDGVVYGGAQNSYGLTHRK